MSDLQFTAQDEQFMRRAMELAELAEAEGEVPVGSVLVKDGEIIAEGLRVHQPELGGKARREQVATMLAEVALSANMINRYPHEFSGGQRQRIAIARALIVRPRFVVLDEPTSALDRSIQVMVVELLRELQQKHGLSYLFISHDLAVVKAMSDRVLVMQGGKCVESGPAEQVFHHPENPYTRRLLSAAFFT